MSTGLDGQVPGPQRSISCPLDGQPYWEDGVKVGQCTGRGTSVLGCKAGCLRADSVPRHHALEPSTRLRPQWPSDTAGGSSLDSTSLTPACGKRRIKTARQGVRPNVPDQILLRPADPFEVPGPKNTPTFGEVQTALTQPAWRKCALIWPISTPKAKMPSPPRVPTPQTLPGQPGNSGSQSRSRSKGV